MKAAADNPSTVLQFWVLSVAASEIPYTSPHRVWLDIMSGQSADGGVEAVVSVWLGMILDQS